MVILTMEQVKKENVKHFLKLLVGPKLQLILLSARSDMPIPSCGVFD